MLDRLWVSGSAPNAPSVPFEEISLPEAAVRYCLDHGGPQRLIVHNSLGDYCVVIVGIITDYIRLTAQEDFSPCQRLGLVSQSEWRYRDPAHKPRGCCLISSSV
jgi:hypothetical protein